MCSGCGVCCAWNDGSEHGALRGGLQRVELGEKRGLGGIIMDMEVSYTLGLTISRS